MKGGREPRGCICVSAGPEKAWLGGGFGLLERTMGVCTNPDIVASSRSVCLKYLRPKFGSVRPFNNNYRTWAIFGRILQPCGAGVGQPGRGGRPAQACALHQVLPGVWIPVLSAAHKLCQKHPPPLASLTVYFILYHGKRWPLQTAPPRPQLHPSPLPVSREVQACNAIPTCQAFTESLGL